MTRAERIRAALAAGDVAELRLELRAAAIAQAVRDETMSIIACDADAELLAAGVAACIACGVAVPALVLAWCERVGSDADFMEALGVPVA